MKTRLGFLAFALCCWAVLALAADSKVIPSDTELSIRTNEEINTTTAQNNKWYSATIERDVMDADGQVAIPKGSPAQLVVRELKTGGAVEGAELALGLDSVNVGGQRYAVTAGDVERGGTGLGRNRRTAEMVGGGAALGAVIGAIAGGGKGAAIGAITGAGAGAAAQVLTKGKEVRVPAETVLRFKLDQPLRLQPASAR